MRWSAEETAKATGGKCSGHWSASSVCIDSREVAPGALFVALKGERADGHAFVADALARGAAAAMVSESPSGVPPEKLLVVPDVQAGLEALGRAGRARFCGKVVGLTGSVGKTSTKEMLRMALAPHGAVFASHGNYNNHIGTPLNLANLPPEADFAVCEMGMNHAGEIAALTRLVRPHVAVITNVEAAHLEFFASVERIADAKCEIFKGLEEGGGAVLNRDNAYFDRCREAALARGARTLLTFGAHAGADCRVISCRATLQGSEVCTAVMGKEIHYEIGTIGAHWALTSACVLAVARALDLDAQKTAAALSSFSELPGRGSLHRVGGALIIDDSYNASPAAMRAAFLKLKELRAAGACPGRVLAALGDMRELGPEAPALHAALAEVLQDAGVDKVWTAGPLMRHLHEALPAAMRAEHVAEAEQLVPLLRAALQPGDVLLVKGSHGSLMYKVAAALLAKKNGHQAVA